MRILVHFVAIHESWVTPYRINLIRLNIDETPMIPLFAAYYNLVREHQAVGKTPAKAAGIDLKLGHDKWNGLIKRAHKYKKTEGKIRVWEEE